ncbi:hypothetical protein F511_41144 [Dorcoceras hygrometricum]|uniref:Uncharacterized protein n=1 Tax=Dorcoceras hygrometricum TaxID=472368 RepID=A0A2Z7C2E3_9LAMI|nr:hypothetical protein F511_41144 [Dorcoceras hygrometricum]
MTKLKIASLGAICGNQIQERVKNAAKEEQNAEQRNPETMIERAPREDQVMEEVSLLNKLCNW